MQNFNTTAAENSVLKPCELLFTILLKHFYVGVRRINKILSLNLTHEHQNNNINQGTSEIVASINCYMTVKTFKLDRLSNGYMSRFTPHSELHSIITSNVEILFQKDKTFNLDDN